MSGGAWKFGTALLVTAAAGIALFAVGSATSAGQHAAPPPPPATQASHAPAASDVRPAAYIASNPRPRGRIAVIVMENEGYADIIGSGQAPFITRLAHRYALAREMFAVSHPSLPNYLALTGGSTFGITSDCTSCSVAATGLATQLQRAGISWKAYMQSLPSPCFTGPGSGDYAKKHDPFLYYRSISRSPSACDRVVPMSELAADERARTLPRFVWITPNLCNDMHDCSVATGDRFLSRLVPGLLRSLGPGGILFLTWDEGTDDSGCCRLASGGHIATIVAGPGARRATRLNTPVDHYSVLRTIEDLFGLPRLRGAACRCTRSLRPLLAG